MKKVLMLAAHQFSSPIQVGSQHYARAFTNLGYKVMYISNPISPLHQMFGTGEELAQKREINRLGGIKEDNILYYVPRALITPRNNFILRSNFAARYWHLSTFPNLLNYISKRNFDKVDILWFGSPIFEFLANRIKHKASICRIADYTPGFSDLSPSQYQQQKRVASKADTVVYTARNLKKELLSYLPKSKLFYLPNGIDTELLKEKDTSFPGELEGIPVPRITYIGAIKEWFHTDLLYKVAKALPKYSFVLIGPVTTEISRLRSLKNVYFLGSQPHDKIAQFLSHSDIGIIPFKRNELVESVNPLKLYEYLYFGLPVVSTRWKELESINSPAYLCDNAREFTACIEKIINGRVKIDRRKLKAFAKKISWKSNLEKLLNNCNLIK